MEIKDKILTEAEALFMKYGIRSVTMDDIARHLSISKKTIYQYFKDKDEMVLLVTKEHLKREKEEMETVSRDASTAIEVLHGITKCMRKNLEDVHDSVLYDIQKYYPKAWEAYLAFKKHIVETFTETLRQGIEEGLFRSDMNPDVLSVVRVELAQIAVDGRTFPRERFDFKQVHWEVWNLFLNGILSEKGREMIKEYDKLQAEK